MGQGVGDATDAAQQKTKTRECHDVSDARVYTTGFADSGRSFASMRPFSFVHSDSGLRFFGIDFFNQTGCVYKSFEQSGVLVRVVVVWRRFHVGVGFMLASVLCWRRFLLTSNHPVPVPTRPVLRPLDFRWRRALRHVCRVSAASVVQRVALQKH